MAKRGLVGMALDDLSLGRTAERVRSVSEVDFAADGDGVVRRRVLQSEAI